MNSTQNSPDNSSREIVKKTYSAPELHIYGDLRQITQTAVGQCHDDGNGCEISAANKSHG
jgi:hypothetical protein